MDQLADGTKTENDKDNVTAEVEKHPSKLPQSGSEQSILCPFWKHDYIYLMIEQNFREKCET